MADQVTVTNLPNSGTTHAVALEVWKLVRASHYDAAATLEGDLALFGKCLDAVRGGAIK